VRIKVPGTEKTKVLDGTTTLYSKDSGGRGVEDMYMLMRLFSDTFDEGVFLSEPTAYRAQS
jgi:hypothetical protein